MHMATASDAAMTVEKTSKKRKLELDADEEPKVVKKSKKEKKEKGERKERKERKEKMDKKGRKERKEKRRNGKKEEEKENTNIMNIDEKALKKDKKSKKYRKEKKEKKEKKHKSLKPSEQADGPTAVVPVDPTPTVFQSSFTSFFSTCVSSAQSPQTKSLLKKPDCPKATCRKSVHFAEGVKICDGDSIKQLYLALDPFGKNRSRAEATSTPAPAPVPIAEEKEKEEKEEKEKERDRENTALAGTTITTITNMIAKPKFKAKHGGSNSNGSATPYLHYLSNFHLHRSLWRFEKSKQNWVLRNALDVVAVPGSSDQALAVYIAGLQGVNARDRLLEEAEKVLAEPGDGERVGRAKLVAKALGRRDLVGDENKEEDVGQKANAADISDDSSSSDESESDSDSD